VRRSLLLTALLQTAALLGLQSCDGWWASTDFYPVADSQQVGSQKAGSILDLMVGASERVKFQGVRRYEAHYSDATGAHSLVYRETVSSDGQGSYAVDPLELLEPQLAPVPESQFLLLQKVRERLLFRYRDFEIRDLAAFTDNYLAVFTGQTTTIAGQAAERLRIQSRTQTDRRYVVDVDPTSGLVLRAREELLDGTLVAQTEFESLDLAPDLSGVAFSQGLTDEEALPPGSKPDLTGLGFQPPVPKQLPAGWRLQEVAKLVDPTDDRAWAKLVYTDGVDLLFFLAAAPEPPQRALVGGSAAQPARVRALSVGAWTVLQGDLAGHELVVMGKADEEVLADLIRSALP
jgi:hypothetical protein